MTVYLCRHQDAEEGLIAYEESGEKSTLPYHIKDLEGGVYPQLGDKVRCHCGSVLLVLAEFIL